MRIDMWLVRIAKYALALGGGLVVKSLVRNGSLTVGTPLGFVGKRRTILTDVIKQLPCKDYNRELSAGVPYSVPRTLLRRVLVLEMPNEDNEPVHVFAWIVIGWAFFSDSIQWTRLLFNSFIRAKSMGDTNRSANGRMPRDCINS